MQLKNEVQQFHQILVECATVSDAQCMLEMTFCVVHRMVGGEEVKDILYISYLVEYEFELCHSTGIT